MPENPCTDQPALRKRGRPRKATTAPPAVAPLAIQPLTVTFRRACEISGLGATTLWARAKDGELEVVRVGRRTLIKFPSLKRLLGIETP